jgi:methyl-accepting chemotaxis protein
VASHRKIILINPRFQIRFSLFLCSLVFISSLMYPAVIYGLLEHIIPADKLATIEFKVFAALGSMQLVFILLVFLVSIVQSHKIAGPMFKLTKSLKDIAAGGPPQKIFFRKGDQFMEVAEAYNNAVEKMTQEHNDDFAYLSEVSSYINNLSLVVPEDKKSVLGEINTKLTEIQERFKAK